MMNSPIAMPVQTHADGHAAEPYGAPSEVVASAAITHQADCISFFAASPGPCDCDAGDRK